MIFDVVKMGVADDCKIERRHLFGGCFRYPGQPKEAGGGGCKCAGEKRCRACLGGYAEKISP